MKPIVVTVIVIVVGGAAFFGGMQYQKSLGFPNGRSNMMGKAQFAGRSGQGTGMIRRNGGQPVSGEVISMDDTSITVKMNDGSSRIVIINDKTIFNKTARLDRSEVKVGETVGIFGVTNADGSVTAQNVQLNPQFRMGTGGGASSESAK